MGKSPVLVNGSKMLLAWPIMTICNKWILKILTRDKNVGLDPKGL